MTTLCKFIENINSKAKFSGQLSYDEPMFTHTTFRLGGKADVWVKPDRDIFLNFVPKLLKSAREEDIPVFILGAGANILVSDRGIRGIVLDTGSFCGIIEEIPRIRRAAERRDAKDADSKSHEVADLRVRVLSGTQVDNLVDELADKGLSGMEFLAGMPGSVGGAVWMNARCYGKSVSDILVDTEILDQDFQLKTVPFRAEAFSYKKSPFQGRENLIISASFVLQHGDKQEILKEIAYNRKDREKKGHYRFPSAGSTFKNNSEFGEPTGKLIEKLGLCGFGIGGAQVAPWHGNIVINTGECKAEDVKKLIIELTQKVKEKKGFDLETEILFAGDW